jgi:predicted transposase YbfD/YdcC
MSRKEAIRQTSIMSSFSVVSDHRKDRNQIYSIFDLITISILGILCGADDWVEVNLWATSNHKWLKTLDICSKGVPSHDTLNRFFRYLDASVFEKCFISWTQKIAKIIGGVIALDGKTICNSADKAEGTRAVHVVSAFSAENDLVLGQLSTDKKSNEITVFPLLIELLDLRGATVTIDAAGCQKSIAKQICEKKGDYVLALKGNQQNLHDEVENFFTQAFEVQPEEHSCDYYKNEECSRGRIELREVWSIDQIDWLPQKNDWKNLKSLVCLKSTRTVKGISTVEYRYYISSLPSDAVTLAYAIRSHWVVENKLHWQLDVSYREDECKIRKGNGPENFSVIRRATLNILKGDKKTKAGIKNKRSKAGWDRQYLLDLLGVN